MIISIFVIDTNSNAKVFRSSNNLSCSKINYYITEFLNESPDQEGIIEKETYSYVYTSNASYKLVMQTTKDSSYKESISLLKYIDENSTSDMFDILITIDNILYDSEGLMMDLKAIKAMDSQEEQIYNMMMENKNLEMKMREKEYQRSQNAKAHSDEVISSLSNMEINDASFVKKEHKAPEIKPKKVEKSSKPVLIIIKEKLKVIIDKESYIKENIINGEMSMVITDPKYTQIQLKMLNLRESNKYSPYLNKECLKKSLFKFDKDRGLNKNIPIMKWTGKSANLPFTFEFWNDEEDCKYLNNFEFKAQKNLENLQFKFSKENLTDIEIEDEYQETEEYIIWNVGSVKKNESRSFEIKCCGFDRNGILPIKVGFKGDALDSEIAVDKVLLEGSSIEEYEVRKILEIDEYLIVNE
jgi:hypothetical protein